jgi:hypothetical protein
MNMSNTAIDQLLQFILLTAGQEDFPDRELGPIHLMKYLYLADLAYAERNNGETYTALAWKFHHFGPWATEAYQRIEPALQQIGATKKTISLPNPKYKEDFVRWSIQDDRLYRQLAHELSFVLTTSIQKYVHKFTANTEDLLHFVYNTWPMLQAKPGELLDFTLPVYLQAEKTHSMDHSDIMVKEQSVTQKKKKKQALEKLKKQFRERLEAKKKEAKITYSPPPYDDVFYDGLKALDSLAGEDLQTIQGIVSFSDDMWKSKARFDPDVS